MRELKALTCLTSRVLSPLDWASLSIPPQRNSVPYNSFSCNPLLLYWVSGYVVVEFWRGKISYTLVVSLSFVRLKGLWLSQGVFKRYSFSFLPFPTPFLGSNIVSRNKSISLKPQSLLIIFFFFLSWNKRLEETELEGSPSSQLM